MTPDIAGIRKRLEGATPGPWAAEPYHGPDPTKLGLFQIKRADNGMLIVFATSMFPSTAVFIANAPTDIAFLLEQNAALQAKIEALEKVEKAAREIENVHSFDSAWYHIDIPVKSLNRLLKALANLPKGGSKNG